MKLFLAVLCFAAALAGCDSDDSPQPTPTATTATSTATALPTPPEACPAGPELCDFALEIQRRMWEADFSWFDDKTGLQPFTCPVPGTMGMGGPFPICNGAVEGEVRQGVRIRRLQSDGGTVEASIVPELRHAILDGGHGLGPFLDAPQIAGFHCPGTPAAPDCRERAVVFFEGAAHLPVRIIGRTWRIAALQFGHFAEDPSVFSSGGAMPFPDQALEPGVYMPWKPPGRSPTRVQERWLFAPSSFSGLSVEPAVGPCPAELALTVVPPPGPFDPGKEPQPTVRIFPGVVGRNVGTTARTGFVEVKPAGAIGGEMRLTIPAETCQPGPLSLVFAGDEWRVAGYRVEAP